MKTKKNYTRTENLHFRATKKEKQMLEERANEAELSLSEYLRVMTTKRKATNEFTASKIEMVVLCQDVVTYVQEKYACEHDKELSERIEKLWTIL